MTENRKRLRLEVEIFCIVLCSVGLFLLVSLLTYESSDPSFLRNSLELSKNACGRVGGALSAVLLHLFGLGAFFLPLGLFFLGLTLRNRDNWITRMEALGGVCIAVTSMTVFLSLQWKTWSLGGAKLLVGGAFGQWLSQILIHYFNPLGSSIITLAIFYLSWVISTPISLLSIGRNFVVKLGSVFISRPLQAFQRLQMKWPKFVFSSPFRFAQKSESNVLGLGEFEGLAKVEPHFEESKLFHFMQKNREQKIELKSEKPESSKLSSEEKHQQSFSIVPRAIPSQTAVKRASVPTHAKGKWKLPPVDFLKHPPTIEFSVNRDRLVAHSQILKQKFADFGIEGEVTAVRPGPVITLYEFKPGPGVKVSRIAALADDLSMALSAESVRILAPLPGKSVVGIEIPSETREMVYLREFLQHPDFYGSKYSIPVVMGKDIGGQTTLSDLARMPHLLCAGQTGSGKSVFMNGLICSLFYRFSPDELRMILVDPKFIEFRAYQDMPHLLLPVVDDPKQASIALRWAVQEMERRYRILAKLGCRNLAGFNTKVEEMGLDVMHDLLFAEENQADSQSSSTHSRSAGSDWIEAFECDEAGSPRVGKLPYIVIVIDELADLMMIAKKDVEISIARIAQKARAAGIHLVIATQRPSTDVVTGLIKANLPSRVSFQLASYVDSKTILDRAGAERLLGQGDMLFIPPGTSQALRLHGAFLDDEEISKITAFLKEQGKPSYRNEILLGGFGEDEDDQESSESADDLFSQAVELVQRSGHASASFLQRHLKVGYNRAARMIETMEARGIVGPQEGSKSREVFGSDRRSSSDQVEF